MNLERGKTCPLLKKDCIQLQCSWFTHLRGSNPQSGDPVDEWACAVTWLPVLLIETSQQVRQGAAATESFRNSMVEFSEKNIRATLAAGALQGAHHMKTIAGEKKNETN